MARKKEQRKRKPASRAMRRLDDDERYGPQAFHPPQMIRVVLLAQAKEVEGMATLAREFPRQKHMLTTGQVLWMIDMCFRQFANIRGHTRQLKFWLDGELSEQQRTDARLVEVGLKAHQVIVRVVLADAKSEAAQRLPDVLHMSDEELEEFARAGAQPLQRDLVAVARRLDGAIAVLRQQGLDGIALFQGLADELAAFHEVMTAPDAEREALQRRFPHLDYFVRNFWEVTKAVIPKFG